MTRPDAYQSKPDYNKRPRFCDEDIELVNREDELFVDDGPDLDLRKDRRRDNDLILGGAEHWSHGGGASTSHIVTHFASDLSILQFVRVLKSLKTSSSSAKANNKMVNGASDKSESSKTRSRRKSAASEIEVKDEPLDAADSHGKGGLSDLKNEDIIDKIQRVTGIVFRDPAAARARWRDEALEDENYMRDEPSLHLTTESSDNLGRRAVCVSTIFRNLSFVPGNEFELSKNTTFLAIAGRLLLLHHW